MKLKSELKSIIVMVGRHRKGFSEVLFWGPVRASSPPKAMVKVWRKGNHYEGLKGMKPALIEKNTERWNENGVYVYKRYSVFIIAGEQEYDVAEVYGGCFEKVKSTQGYIPLSELLPDDLSPTKQQDDRPRFQMKIVPLNRIGITRFYKECKAL